MHSRRMVPHPTDNLTTITKTDVHKPVSGPGSVGGPRETLQPPQNPADPK